MNCKTVKNIIANSQSSFIRQIHSLVYWLTFKKILNINSTWLFCCPQYDLSETVNDSDAFRIFVLCICFTDKLKLEKFFLSLELIWAIKSAFCLWNMQNNNNKKWLNRAVYRPHNIQMKLNSILRRGGLQRLILKLNYIDRDSNRIQRTFTNAWYIKQLYTYSR